jgi:hypothetical protein
VGLGKIAKINIKSHNYHYLSSSFMLHKVFVEEDQDNRWLITSSAGKMKMAGGKTFKAIHGKFFLLKNAF